MNSLLIDTNIMIYAKDVSSIFYSWANEVIENHLCFTSSKNLVEYYSVVTKSNDPILSTTEALQDLKEFSEFFKVLLPNLSTYQKLMELTARYSPKGLKIHDFEIAAIALSNGISKIATVNVADFNAIREINLVYPEH